MTRGPPSESHSCEHTRTAIRAVYSIYSAVWGVCMCVEGEGYNQHKTRAQIRPNVYIRDIMNSSEP